MCYRYHDIKKFFDLAGYVMHTPTDGHDYLGSRIVNSVLFNLDAVEQTKALVGYNA
jgi:hypothetical protein